MIFHVEARLSDIPLVERIWRTQGDRTGEFISQAKVTSEMVWTTYDGKITFTVRGPETKATILDYRSVGAEFLGITFKLGAFMPHLLPKDLRDGRDVNVPEVTRRSFWLYGSKWQIPDYENADTFVASLIREGLLMTDPLVNTMLEGRSPRLSIRSVQYRFLRATGLTNKTIQQIERARYAGSLLQRGVSILDTVFEAGYADQAHLTRSLKRFSVKRQLNSEV